MASVRSMCGVKCDAQIPKANIHLSIIDLTHSSHSVLLLSLAVAGAEVQLIRGANWAQRLAKKAHNKTCILHVVTGSNESQIIQMSQLNS